MGGDSRDVYWHRDSGSDPMTRKKKVVTVDLPQYKSYCPECSRTYEGARDMCFCGGKQTRTTVVREVVRYTNVPEALAKFLVRFQEGRLVK